MNDEHVPTNGEETKTDCLRKGQRLRQLRVERFLDAVYLSGSVLRSQTRVSPPPSSPADQLSNNRKEKCKHVLAMRRYEQVRLKALREDRELAEVAKAQRLAREREDARRKRAKSVFEARVATRQKLAAAKQHSLKSIMRYNGWIPWATRVKTAQLQDIKAKRHYQYCIMQNVWGLWKLALARSKSTKANEVAKIMERANLMRQKEAWRRWRYHQHYLTVITSRVKCQVHLATLSNHWHQWMTAVNKRTYRGRIFEQRAVEMGVRVAVKRLFTTWKTSVRVARTKSLLAEERHQVWQQVNLWLTQH